MTKDKLLLRLTEIEGQMRQEQANIQQLMANINMLMGSKQEIERLLDELLKETTLST